MTSLGVKDRTRGCRSSDLLTLAITVGEAPPRNTSRQVNEWLDDCGNEYARAFSNDGLHWIECPGLGTFAFSDGSLEVRVWPTPGARHETIVNTFCMFQPVILQALGWQALHAGAAVGPSGVLAFCGKAWSGKSTLAFAMQQAGWLQFADDALVVRLDRHRVITYRLPFSPRLRPASRAHFAQAESPLCCSSEPGPFDPPLSALFILQQDVSLNGPRVSLMPQAQAFPEVLAHAHCFDLEDRAHARRLAEDYLELVARVPIFTLEYPPRFQNLQRLTRDVMEAAGSIDARGNFSFELA